MPEFHLDTSGGVPFDSHHGGKVHLQWGGLDSFTQGYVTALFFTENAPGVTTEEWQAAEDHAEGTIPEDVAFADLDPDALAKILADCAKFQDSRAWVDTLEGHQGADEEHAGRDFWYTRNGHGCGFWDGDWPEPYATQLTDVAKAFGEVSVYLGDDGKVYLDL